MFLDIDNPKSAKIIAALSIELVDKKFKGLVSSTVGKDKEGKERTYQNINQVDSYGKGKVTKTVTPESEDW